MARNEETLVNSSIFDSNCRYYLGIIYVYMYMYMYMLELR